MFFAKRKVKDFIDYGNIKDEKLLKLLRNYVVQRVGKTCNFVNGQNFEKSMIVLLLL